MQVFDVCEPEPTASGGASTALAGVASGETGACLDWRRLRRWVAVRRRGSASVATLLLGLGAAASLGGGAGPRSSIAMPTDGTTPALAGVGMGGGPDGAFRAASDVRLMPEGFGARLLWGWTGLGAEGSGRGRVVTVGPSDFDLESAFVGDGAGLGDMPGLRSAFGWWGGRRPGSAASGLALGSAPAWLDAWDRFAPRGAGRASTQLRSALPSEFSPGAGVTNATDATGPAGGAGEATRAFYRALRESD